MTLSKRMFDLLAALFLAVVLAPVMVLISLLILILDGRPVFYFSERMKTPSEPFKLVKFRTMRPTGFDSGVSGADKAARITPIGRTLRLTRLDELPQVYNILVGHMSFVGPRPPLRQYVEDFPAVYERVLKSRPGVTGLATLIFHRTEERLLSSCTTSVQTDQVYRRRCVPRKARIDLIYYKNRTVCWDMWLTAVTVLRFFPVRLRLFRRA